MSPTVLLSMPIHTPWQQWIGPKLRRTKPKMPIFQRPQMPAYYFYQDKSRIGTSAHKHTSSLLRVARKLETHSGPQT